MNRALILATLVTATLTSGCAPVMLCGGAAVGTAVVKEKTMGEAFNDSQISSKLKIEMLKHKLPITQYVGVNVQSSEVLLTGAVPTQEMHLEAVRLSWSIRGVKRVIDEIQVAEADTFGSCAQDSWITTKVKSTLLMDGDIKSRNYSLKTVGGVVYIMGVAQDQTELNKVTTIARNTRGVTKVVSYAKLKDVPEGQTDQEGQEKQSIYEGQDSNQQASSQQGVDESQEPSGSSQAEPKSKGAPKKPAPFTHGPVGTSDTDTVPVVVKH